MEVLHLWPCPFRYQDHPVWTSFPNTLSPRVPNLKYVKSHARDPEGSELETIQRHSIKSFIPLASTVPCRWTDINTKFVTRQPVPSASCPGLQCSLVRLERFDSTYSSNCIWELLSLASAPFSYKLFEVQPHRAGSAFFWNTSSIFVLL